MPPYLTLNIIRYGSRISGAIQGKEQHPPLHISAAPIEKGAFRSPLTMVGQLIYIYTYHSMPSEFKQQKFPILNIRKKFIK